MANVSLGHRLLALGVRLASLFPIQDDEQGGAMFISSTMGWPMVGPNSKERCDKQPSKVFSDAGGRGPKYNVSANALLSIVMLH